MIPMTPIRPISHAQDGIPCRSDPALIESNLDYEADFIPVTELSALSGSVGAAS